MKKSIIGTYTLALICLVCSIVIPFWPLGVCSIFILALAEHWFLALMFGVLLDMVYGVPPGWSVFLSTPFTLLAVVLGLLPWLTARYVRKDMMSTLY